MGALRKQLPITMYQFPWTMSSSSASTADILRVLISVLLPPVGVFLQEGLGKQFWINVLLTLLGYVPGLVHAIWIIARR